MRRVPLNEPLWTDLGKLTLRLSLGGLMLFHGFTKLGNSGALQWIGGQLGAAGLPEFLAYGVYVGEIVAPLMVVRGDGGLMNASIAEERPVETVHSGPAASAIGARFLSKQEKALVIDI